MKGMKSVRVLEAELFEAEETIRVLGKAMDLIQVRALKNGWAWHPSEEAVSIMEYAKDRLTEWRRINDTA